MKIEKLRNDYMEKKHQGDVIFRLVDVSPDELKIEKTNVVQDSDHPHLVENGAVALSNDLKFVIANDKTKIVHSCDDENKHETVDLSPGVWFVDRVMMVGFFDDMISPVVD